MGKDKAHNFGGVGPYVAPQGKINDYEFQQNKGAVTEEERHPFNRPEVAGSVEGGESPKGAAMATGEEDEVTAEHESAAAMNADVPQPPGGSETTEGQPT